MSGQAPQPGNVPAIGDTIADKYVVEGQIGAGGMGVVLKARHGTLGHLVAIKLLRPEAAKHENAKERFLREARATINLRSEHVARVIDVGTLDDETPYMVIEHLEGRDLDQVSQGQSLSIDTVVEYVLQAAEALAEAHSLGIVHRDLKPANLFLTARADGAPLIKVLDFGIAKAFSPQDRGITTTQALMGSPGYMSPEQIRSAKHVDQRADIWGLGVILYELLTGKPPFDGDNIATLSVQIATEVPVRADQMRPGLPAALADVVARCLEKDPDQRFQSIAELGNALQPFAPAHTSALLERIRRIGGASAFAATVNADAATVNADAATSLGDAVRTAQAWGDTQTPRAKPGWLLWVGLTAALAVLVFAVFLVGRFSATPQTDAAASASAPSGASPSAVRVAQPDPAVAIETQPAPASSIDGKEATLPNDTVDAAAPPAAQSTAPKPKPRVIGQRPKRSEARDCPSGQTLSKGHCCPTGMVWQNDRCDRPLATSLP